METTRHRVFICYHHQNDQFYKDSLQTMNKIYDIFVDMSVGTGDIDDSLPDDRIREIIRDDYLRDSTVTIILVGTETKRRKHIDWEIYSSMYDGIINKKSGILVINLPSINNDYFTADHEGEKRIFYPNVTDWISINDRSEYERRYPYMPDRVIDNLLKPEAKISVVNWDKIANNIEGFRFLIDQTFNERTNCIYDLNRPMRRKDS